MKKILNYIFLLFLLVSCSNKSSDNKEDFVVGILQIASHSALDAANKGFKDCLKEKGLNIKYIDTNANGDISVANLNAKNLINRNANLIYAIGTPAAQSASNATATTPIIFSAVTDNISAKLTNANVTGVLDYIDAKIQIQELLKIKKDVKKIGFIYNSSEQNSVYQLEAMKNAAKDFDITIIEKGVTSVNEIPQVVDSLCLNSDAIYTPADNLVASSINLIAERAIKNKVISFGAESAHVDGGILMSVGISYYDLGKMAGEIAYKILKDNEKIENLPVQRVEDVNLVINDETKKKLGLEF